MCVSRRRPPTCLWPDGSPKFKIIFGWSNPRSLDRRNHGAPKTEPNPDSHKPHLTFESFSYNRRVFFGDFLWSVCRHFEDLSSKTSFEIQPTRIDCLSRNPHTVRCKYDEHVLFCQSWQLAQARKDPCLFFRAHDPDRSHGFLQKSSRCSTKETKHCLSKIPLNYNSTLNM